MEALIKTALGSTLVESFGEGGGGCISKGHGYFVGGIGNVFVKQNDKPGAKEMLLGEYYGLMALQATNCIKVPKPIKVFDLPSGGAALVVEYLEMRHLDQCAVELGERLARLHLHNSLRKHSGGDSSEYVSRFGFDCTTCCGYLPQDNAWSDDWPIDRATKDGKNKELAQKWLLLYNKVPEFFRGLDIYPCLLHGDLWSGNTAETGDPAEPVIFDPAAVFGHHEFDLSIAAMFGGFNPKFYESYHKILPKADGFASRQNLYQLYHYLNHYNHFGGGYLHSSLRIMDDLLKLSSSLDRRIQLSNSS